MRFIVLSVRTGHLSPVNIRVKAYKKRNWIEDFRPDLIFPAGNRGSSVS